MQERKDTSEMPRREFLLRVGAAGLAVTLGGADAIAATGAASAPVLPPATLPPKPDSAAAAAPTISEDAKALTAILQRRFPGRLSAEQWDKVTAGLDQRLDSGRRLKSVKLANGDEPDFTFKA